MNVIKGPNMRDVCFEVHEVNQEDDNYLIKGMWWNIAMGEPFPIGNSRGLIVETIKIKKSEFHKWSDHANPRAAKASTKSA